MKNGKFAKRGVASKALVLILALMLVVGATIGGTLAWLVSTSGPVTNTFTVGDINIELKESELNADGTLNTNKEVTENTYSFVPGDTLNKDPFVRVKADSEACYLFVKVEAQNNTNGNVNILSYSIDASWTEVPGHAGYYYMTLGKTTADTEYNILANKTVTVSDQVTKDMVTTINASGTQPKLVFNAAAIQSDNLTAGEYNTVIENAWQQLFA